MQQRFEVVLTKAYVDNGISDTDKLSKSIELQDLQMDIYRALVQNKAGLPSVVMNITNLNIDEAVYLEDSKVVMVKSSFNILYRFNLI